MANSETDYRVELVAQVLHQAVQECPWADEAAICKERYREYARNAINLLGDDIGVLLLALEERSSKH